MKQYSASHTTSRNSSLPHNRREEKYTGKNVNPDGVHEEWYRVEIEDLYEELFSEAIEEYNAKQKRNDRKILGGAKEYLERIRNEWAEYYQRGIVENGKLVRHFNDYDDALKHLNYNRGRNPRSAYYESIVQIGNHENQPDEKTCKAILKEYVDTFQERNPNLRLMEVHYHADEKTPHIHLDFVPVATGYKQGLEVQNGFDKALMQQMGLERSGTKFKTPSLAWYEQEQKVLSEIALQYGIEISSEKVLEPGKKEHESVKAYKERMQGKRELDERENALDDRETTLNEKEVNLSHERQKLTEEFSEASGDLKRRRRGIIKKETDLKNRERDVETKEEDSKQRLQSLEADFLHMQSEHRRLEKLSDEIYKKGLDDFEKYVLNWMKKKKLNENETVWEHLKPLVEADYQKTMKPKSRPRETSEPKIFDAVSAYDRSKYISKPISKDRDLER